MDVISDYDHPQLTTTINQGEIIHFQWPNRPVGIIYLSNFRRIHTWYIRWSQNFDDREELPERIVAWKCTSSMFQLKVDLYGFITIVQGAPYPNFWGYNHLKNPQK